MFLASRVTLFSCIGEPPGSRSIPSVIERVIFGWQGSLARKCKSGSTVLRGGSVRAVAYVLPERRLA
jgi:hypothetical protein